MKFSKLLVVFLAVLILGGASAIFLWPKNETSCDEEIVTEISSDSVGCNVASMFEGMDSSVKNEVMDIMPSEDINRYVEYTEDDNNGDVVLFFHASWCPSCKAADRDFILNEDLLPEDMKVLKIDYDSSGDLRKKYSITSQHTFVQLDNSGNEVTRWVGGGVNTLLDSLVR